MGGAGGGKAGFCGLKVCPHGKADLIRGSGTAGGGSTFLLQSDVLEGENNMNTNQGGEKRQDQNRQQGDNQNQGQQKQFGDRNQPGQRQGQEAQDNEDTRRNQGQNRTEQQR